MPLCSFRYGEQSKLRRKQVKIVSIDANILLTHTETTFNLSFISHSYIYWDPETFYCNVGPLCAASMGTIGCGLHSS